MTNNHIGIQLFRFYLGTIFLEVSWAETNFFIFF